jgi:hypothetical protein
LQITHSRCGEVVCGDAEAIRKCVDPDRAHFRPRVVALTSYIVILAQGTDFDPVHQAQHAAYDVSYFGFFWYVLVPLDMLAS